MRKFWKRFTGIFLIALVTVSAALCFDTQTALAEVTWPTGPSVEAPSAIVMDVTSGTVLYEKNADQKLYPASITKVLTTLVALENADKDDVITFSTEAIDNSYGSSIARDYGEQMTLEQTLYGVMLESANECAYAAAEYVGGGDYDRFIEMMNEKAAELGCTNSNFANCNGLPQSDHWTCCRDMALISAAAYQNEDFRTICGTTSYTIPPTNKHDVETNLNNHHMMFSRYKGSKYLYEYAVGGKTGWTDEANYTLVTYAEKDGMTLVCVVMNCPTQDSQYESTETLFDYCFDNFKWYNVKENETRFEVQAKNSHSLFSQGEDFAQVDENAEVILPVSADFNDTVTEVSYDNVGGDVLGTLIYTYADRVVGEADVVTTGVKVDGYLFGKKTGSMELNLVPETEEETESEKSVMEQIKSLFTDENGSFQLKKMDLETVVFLLICLAVVVILVVALSLAIGRARRRRRRRRRNPYAKKYKKIRRKRR